jgi:hypothetical protein
MRFVFLAVPLAGLAAVAGCLGQPDRLYFSDLVDGSVDATTDVGTSSGEDAFGTGDDGPTTADATVDGPTTDGSPDAADAEAPDAQALDASDAADVADVIEASPCGPTDTLQNCGACGNACDTTHSSPTSCSGTSCVYSGCDAGWGDCVKTAPNVNGCETPLNTPSNCGACGTTCDTAQSTGAGCSGGNCSYTGCKSGFVDCKTTAPNTDGCETPVSATLHSTGITGLSYNDCAPKGTDGLQQALEACTAYTGDGSQCATFSCSNAANGPIVCSTGALTKNCYCWSYGGGNKGYVDNSGGPPGNSGNNCFCPSTTLDPTWN